MKPKKIRKNEAAISPVIGVILIVAITVILAAVIAAFMFGMESPEKSTTTHVDIQQNNTTNNTTDTQKNKDVTKDSIAGLKKIQEINFPWSEKTL